MELKLVRFATGLGGTFGAIISGSTPIVLSIELPWTNNIKNVSCIPASTYHCVYSKHPDHGMCYELQNVAGRSGILIHTANTIHDIKGCIGVASYFGFLNEFPGLPAILNQPIGKGAGYNKFMKFCENIPDFKIEIINNWS